MRSRFTAPLLAATLMFGAAGLSGCSDDTKDKVDDATEAVGDDIETKTSELKENAEDGTGTVASRAAAEALRASLKANDTADSEGLRSVAAIEEASADLPGDPEVRGVEDGDDDGLDDDGKVQVGVGDQAACLMLPAEGDDTEVESGAC